MPSRSTGSKREGLRYDLAPCVEWRCAQARAEVGGDGNKTAEAKLRLAIAQAHAKELENVKREGRLIEMAAVKGLVEEAFGDIRAGLISLASQVTTLTDDQRAQLDSAIDDLMGEISTKESSFETAAEESLERFELHA